MVIKTEEIGRIIWKQGNCLASSLPSWSGYV